MASPQVAGGTGVAYRKLYKQLNLGAQPKRSRAAVDITKWRIGPGKSGAGFYSMDTVCNECISFATDTQWRALF